MSVLLVDLSSVLVPHYHAHGKRIGGNDTCDSTVFAINSLAAEYGHDGVAICCDAPGVPTWRKELCPSYKADRPPWEDLLIDQYVKARGALEHGAGYAVFVVPGFEGEDLVASVIAKLWNSPNLRFVVASSDKDVVQMICPRVTVWSPGKKRLLDAAAALEIYGVRPNQIRDYLCMTGDASDGIAGIKGIGEVTAKKLLAKHGTLEEILRVAGGPAAAELGIPQSKVAALLAGSEAADIAHRLVTLRKDAPVDVSKVRRVTR